VRQRAVGRRELVSPRIPQLCTMAGAGLFAYLIEACGLRPEAGKTLPHPGDCPPNRLRNSPGRRLVLGPVGCLGRNLPGNPDRYLLRNALGSLAGDSDRSAPGYSLRSMPIHPHRHPAHWPPRSGGFDSADHLNDYEARRPRERARGLVRGFGDSRSVHLRLTCPGHRRNERCGAVPVRPIHGRSPAFCPRSSEFSGAVR